MRHFVLVIAIVSWSSLPAFADHDSILSSPSAIHKLDSEPPYETNVIAEPKVPRAQRPKDWVQGDSETNEKKPPQPAPLPSSWRLHRLVPQSGNPPVSNDNSFFQYYDPEYLR